MNLLHNEQRTALEIGKSQFDVIAEMKARGMTIVDAIKAVRELFSVGLGEAKQLVTSHPEWAATAAAAIPLQEELIRSFEELGSSAACQPEDKGNTAI